MKIVLKAGASLFGSLAFMLSATLALASVLEWLPVSVWTLVSLALVALDTREELRREGGDGLDAAFVVLSCVLAISDLVLVTVRNPRGAGVVAFGWTVLLSFVYVLRRRRLPSPGHRAPPSDGSS